MEHKTEFQEKMDKHGDFYAVHGEKVKQVSNIKIDGALSDIGHKTLEAAVSITFDGYGIVTIEPGNDLVYYFVFKPGKRPLAAIESNRAIGWDEEISSSRALATVKAMSYRYDNEIPEDILNRLEWLMESETELTETDLYNLTWRESQRGDEYPTAAIWNHYHILDGEVPTGDLLDPEPHSIYLPHVIYNFYTRLTTHNTYFKEFPNEAHAEPLPVEDLKILQWMKDHPIDKVLKAGEEAQQAFKEGIEALKEAIDALYMNAQGDYLAAPEIIVPNEPEAEPAALEEVEGDEIKKVKKFVEPAELTLIKNKVIYEPFMNKKIVAVKGKGIDVNIRPVKHENPSLYVLVHIGSDQTLNFNQLLILNAVSTIRKAGNEYATATQIAKLLYQGNSTARSDSKFTREVEEMAIKMLSIPATYDLKAELDFYANWKSTGREKQDEKKRLLARKEKSRLFLEHYDGDGILRGNLINATFQPVKLADNGRITDAFVFGNYMMDRKIDEWLEIRNQIKNLPEGVKNPLTPNMKNVAIFNFILDKINEMPYDKTYINFLADRKRYLEILSQEKKALKAAATDRERVLIAQRPSQAAELKNKWIAREQKYTSKNRRIRMDSLVEQLERAGYKINITRINEAVQKILESFKTQGIINNYEIDYEKAPRRGRKDARRIQSYTISFFQ